jgi:hypothetical protein
MKKIGMVETGVLFLTLLLLSCTHRVDLIDFNTGQVLKGEYNEANRKVTVYMPDGQILTGKYSAIDNAGTFFGTGFGFSGTTISTSFGQGVVAGGRGQVYALLKSNKSKLMMEIIVSHSKWGGHGFGEAITNDGRKYKVQF